MTHDIASKLESKLRMVPDFPVKGIKFIDITTLLGDPSAFKAAIDALKDACAKVDFDVIVAPESRGFIIGSALAYAMGKAFAPVRKKGKLPYKTVSGEYQLEYGTDTLQIHVDAVKPGQKVLVLDDLLATGGTIGATADMVEKIGGVVSAVAFLIELTYIPGRANLVGRGHNVISVIKIKD